MNKSLSSILAYFFFQLNSLMWSEVPYAVSTLSCYLLGLVLEGVRVQLVQGGRRREWRSLGQLEEPWSSDTAARVWERYKGWGQQESRKLKLRNHYRLQVRIIYIIDRRFRPPLITAGIEMISPKIESRRGQELETNTIEKEKKNSKDIILTCSLSLLYTHDQKPLVTGQH